MTTLQIIGLINGGSVDNVRGHLKKLGIGARMTKLNELVPQIKSTPETLKFFHNHFSKEVGALITSNFIPEDAVKIYEEAKRIELSKKPKK
jgi:hypothetical protein